MLQVRCGAHTCPQWFLASIQTSHLYPLIFSRLDEETDSPNMDLDELDFEGWDRKPGKAWGNGRPGWWSRSHKSDEQAYLEDWMELWVPTVPSQQKRLHSPLRSVLESQEDFIFSFCMRCVRFCFCFINLAWGIHLSIAQLCPVYFSWPKAFHLWGGVIIGHRHSSYLETKKLVTLGQSKQYIYYSGR